MTTSLTTPAAQRPLPAALLAALLLTLSCGALLACSPRQTTPPTRDDAAASTPVATAPCPAPAASPAPAAVATPVALPVATPAECATVDDCATTRFEEGACCAMLCSPRATTKKALQEAAKAQCNTLAKCAQPLCLPPRFQHRLACEAGRCVMQQVGRVEQER